jgi:hypothetical protein
MKLIAITALSVLTLGVGQALAATNHHGAAAKSTLVVAMHDPGCHWFSIHGTFEKAATVAGPVRVRNMDEATLKVASRSGTRYIKVGRSLVLERGNYVVMMVGQAVDDNYLTLTVR